MKKLFNQKTFNVIVLFTLFSMGVLLYLAFCQINDQSKVQSANSKNQYEALTRQASINASNAYFKQLVVSVSEKAVYLPDVKIKLPLDDQTLSLVYGARDVGNPDKDLSKTYDVATQEFLNIAPTMTTTLSCVPVRFSFEAKANPFNPHEKAVKPVLLADGRIMQIYVTSHDSCDNVWSISQTVPAEIATTLQKATSY